MYRLRSVLGGEFELDLGKEQVFDPLLTHILYWRDINTTHFITKDPQRGRLATVERAGLHWKLQRFLPGGDALADRKRTRHEADFAALMHAYLMVSRFGL